MTTECGPLDGLLVADFSRILAGPYATMLLADLGAEVIKVEAPSGDDTRTWVPPDRDGVSTYYLAINRNKRSVALNLADAGDLDLARELVSRADIMIENFRPGGLRRFGLDYESVSTDAPGPDLRIDQWFRHRGWGVPARLRPVGAGCLRLDDPHR